MDEKRALQIAYNLLNDELDTQDEEYGYESGDDDYYQVIEAAMTRIKTMIEERK